jgi:hypothetical protein
MFLRGLIKVGKKSITLDGRRLQQGQQLFEAALACLIWSIKAARFIHRVISRYNWDSTASWQEEMSGHLNAARNSFPQRHQHPKKVLFLLEVDDKGILRMKI